ncbi:MAG: prephenate dehydrogenase [Gammaproteobacteria bacterium]|nr:prephenate dehydrogenase [Gammaproteobacteria bacterium]
MSRLVLVGTGLIGGSVALAARAAGLFSDIHGMDADADAARLAVELGVIDEMVDGFDDVRTISAVCVAVPTRALVDVLQRALDAVPDDVPVFDVGSVKAPVIDGLTRRRGPSQNFVPCHPLAGSEQQGAGAARVDLFRDRSVVITPTPETDDALVRRVEQWWRAMGADVAHRDADAHDRVVALTSHLPHLLAFALMGLVKRQDPDDIATHIGGGFRDFSRIAGSDPNVWSDILSDNRGFVSEHVGALIDELTRMQDLAANDPAQLAVRLNELRDARRSLDRRPDLDREDAGSVDPSPDKHE